MKYFFKILLYLLSLVGFAGVAYLTSVNIQTIVSGGLGTIGVALSLPVYIGVAIAYAVVCIIGAITNAKNKLVRNLYILLTILDVAAIVTVLLLLKFFC